MFTNLQKTELEDNVWWAYQRSTGSSVWPLTWSNHHYGMWPTSLGPGHQWIPFFSGNWLFMEFLILWAPLHCRPPQPSFLSGSIFLSFPLVPQALGSSISAALKHFPQQPWLLPSFIHSENPFNFLLLFVPEGRGGRGDLFLSYSSHKVYLIHLT